MKKVIMAVCLIGFVGVLGGCGKDNNEKKDTGNKEEVKNVVEKREGTSIYLIAVNESDMVNEGSSLDLQMGSCGNDLVEISLGKKISPQDTVKQLLAYEKYDKENGGFNAFAMSNNLKLENILIKNDFAIVTLSEGLIPGELCQDMQLYSQIRKTLLQFDEIKGADVFVGEEELSSYLRSTREKEMDNAS